MESKSQHRFGLGRQSSLAPERNDVEVVVSGGDDDVEGGGDIDPGVRLMYMANEGVGIKEALDSGTSVNFRDIDGLTALHVFACQGHNGVVAMLLRSGAEVDVKDRWGSTGTFCIAMWRGTQVAVKKLERHSEMSLLYFRSCAS